MPVSFEEFLKQSGGTTKDVQVLDKSNVINPKQPANNPLSVAGGIIGDTFKGIGSSLYNLPGEIVKNATQSSELKTGDISSIGKQSGDNLLGVAGAVANTILSPFTALGTAITDNISKSIIQSIGDNPKVVSHPLVSNLSDFVQKSAGDIQTLVEENPRAARDLANAVSVIFAAIAVPQYVESGRAAINTAKQGIAKVTSSLGGTSEIPPSQTNAFAKDAVLRTYIDNPEQAQVLTNIDLSKAKNLEEVEKILNDAYMKGQSISKVDLSGAKNSGDIAKKMINGLPDTYAKDSGTSAVTRINDLAQEHSNMMSLNKPKPAIPQETAYTKSGRYLSNIFIRPGDKAAKLLQDYEAGVSKLNPITPADTAARRGISGTDRQIGNRATAEADSIWKNSVKPAVDSIKEPLKTKTLMDDLQKYVNAEKDLTRRVALQKALDKIKEDYKGKKQDTYTGWQEVKSSIDSHTPKKAFTDDPVASANKDIQHELADNIRQRTYAKLSDINIKQDYLDLGNLQKMQIEGIKVRTADTAGRPSFVGIRSAIIDHSIQPIITKLGTFIYNAGDYRIISKTKLPTSIKTVEDFVKNQGGDIDKLIQQGIIYSSVQSLSPKQENKK